MRRERGRERERERELHYITVGFVVQKSKDPMDAAKKRAELEKRLQVSVVIVTAPTRYSNSLLPSLLLLPSFTSPSLLLLKDVSGKLGGGSKPKLKSKSSGE